jgi:outer membrane protein TolC
MKVIILLVCFVATTSVWAKNVGLDELKRMTLENSYGVKSKEVDLRLSELNVGLAKSKLYPRLGIEVGKEWVKSDLLDESDDLASIYGEVNLFNGFKDSSLIKKEKINLKSAKIDLDNHKFNLGLEVEKAFYEYLYSKKKLSITSSEIKRTNTLSSLVKKRVSSKLLTDSDIIEFRLHQKKTRSFENYLKLEMEQLHSKLAVFTGIKNTGELIVLGEIPHFKVSSTLEELIENMEGGPRIRKLQFEGKVADIEKKSSNSGWYPSLNLRAEHGRLDEIETGISSNETSSKITLKASWELFSGFETTKKRELQKNKRIKIDYAKKQVKQDLSILVKSKYKTLKVLEETIEFEEENEKLARKLYSKTLAEYKKGIKDSSALIDSSQKITESQNRVFELKLNYILTKVSLEKSLGRQLDFTLVHQ